MARLRLEQCDIEFDAPQVLVRDRPRLRARADVSLERFLRAAAAGKIIRAALDFYWPTDPASSVRHAVDAIRFFVPTFKNPDFLEENERRLIFTPHPGAGPQPRFRTRRGLLVPYYSLKELSHAFGRASRSIPRAPDHERHGRPRSAQAAQRGKRADAARTARLRRGSRASVQDPVPRLTGSVAPPFQCGLAKFGDRSPRPSGIEPDTHREAQS